MASPIRSVSLTLSGPLTVQALFAPIQATDIDGLRPHGVRKAMGIVLRTTFALRVLFIGLAMLRGATASAEGPSGRWYAEGVEDGQYLQWIEENHDDGTFTIAIRFINGCDVSQSETETGLWHYADHTLTKWTRTVNYRRVPDTDYYHDTWLATPVDGDHVQFLDVKTHVTWAASRVAQGFVFPVPSRCESS